MKALKSIIDIKSQGKGIDLMTMWISDASAVFPQQYKNVLLFNTLTGLGPNKARKEIHLIKANRVQYLDKERMMPKHHQFPKSVHKADKE
jgi:hypothetical protein